MSTRRSAALASPIDSARVRHDGRFDTTRIAPARHDGRFDTTSDQHDRRLDMTQTFSSDLADDRGLLDTGDGNLVSWETRGNPDGKPAVIVHGGPGAGRPSGSPRSFDPQRYRIILFDQRGCGLSTPHAADPATDMSLNTTEHLLRDMEQLREHLGVQRWLLHGGSWGSALSLAYAERHPDRVSEIVMPAFWSMSRAETDWLYRGGVSPLFPREWERFVNGAARSCRATVRRPDCRVRPAAGIARSRRASQRRGGMGRLGGRRPVAGTAGQTDPVQQPRHRCAAGLRPDLRQLRPARWLVGGRSLAPRRRTARRDTGRHRPRAARSELPAGQRRGRSNGRGPSSN